MLFCIVQIMRTNGVRKAAPAYSHNPRHYVTWRGFAQPVAACPRIYVFSFGMGKGRRGTCRNTANAVSDLRTYRVIGESTLRPTGKDFYPPYAVSKEFSRYFPQIISIDTSPPSIWIRKSDLPEGINICPSPAMNL